MIGGAAAYAAARPHLAWARRLRGVNGTPPLLQPWWLPAEAPSTPIDLTRALVGAAVLAPSEWNTQPWRFESDGGTLRLVADAQRSLPATDPDQRGMMMSLGAALENLLVAARTWGLQPTVAYFPRPGTPRVVAEVSWSNSGPHRDRALFEAIPARRTNRKEYDGRGIFPQNRAQLIAQIPEGLRLYWLDDGEMIRAVADIARDATHAQMMDAHAQAEQYSWMRFGSDARRRGDGIPLDALEVSTLSRFMAKRYYNPESWFMRFGADGAAKQLQGAVRSSGALALLAAASPGDSTHVMAGQALERFALKATQLGVAMQPISAPIELERYRAPLARAFRAGGDTPLLLLRLGHARRPDPTPRRSAWVVTTFRNS